MAWFIVNKLKERGHIVTLVDPLEFRFPLLDKMYKEYTAENVPEILEKLAKIIKQAEAYIIVTMLLSRSSN